MLDLTHYIDGSHTDGESGRFADVFNPATGEVEKRTPLASAAELNKAVEAAKAAQPGWAAQNPQKRARVFMKLAMLLEDNKRAMAEDLSREHGKTIEDSIGDIQRGLEVVEFVETRKPSTEFANTRILALSASSAPPRLLATSIKRPLHTENARNALAVRKTT